VPLGHFQAWLFGPFRVIRDGDEIADPTWGRKSSRTLLKWFLLSPGRPFSGAELGAVLWAGRPASDTAKNLHVTLHHLRRVLEPGLPGRRPSRFIRTDETGRYWFDPLDRWWTDADEAESLWGSADASRERGDDDAAIATLHELLAYYGQGFLPEELYEDAFAPFRDAHDRKHDEALHALLKLYRATDRRYEVLACATQILDRDPYSECAVTALVEVYLAQGSPATAISELDRFAQVLNDDLGMPPSPNLIALRERLRRPR
jgi:DNA-binding SARP family transcriptional activator